MKSLLYPLHRHLMLGLLALAALVTLPSAQALDCSDAAAHVQGAFLSYYGRAADPEGLAYWTAQLESSPSCNLDGIIDAFSTSPEHEALYGDKRDADIIDMLYQSLFNRAPDPDGKAFYMDALAAETRSLATIALDIYFGALNEDAEMISNKRTVADYLTSEVGLTGSRYDSENRNEASAILAVVTADEATIAAGRTAVDQFIMDYSVPLTIAHINDHHSHLESNGGELSFDGVDTDVEMGGFPRVVTKLLEIAATKDRALLLHAGDAITGTIYFTSFKGEADADLMNQVCFDAFALGNHEFDDGDAGLARFLGFLNGDIAICETPVLAANVVPAVGTPLRPDADTSLIQPYTVLERDGQQYGIIGIDIANKTKNSSSPLDSTEFLDETTTAQHSIDELTGMGVDKIILLTHYQYANDIEMAQNLRGVDVIVGGDSHSLLGDVYADFGLNPVGPYPTQVTDLDGNPVCIVQAWEYANVVGELQATFNGSGQVTSCSGHPILLLGERFQRDDVELEGADRQAVLDIIAATPELEIVAPDAASEAILAPYTDQIADLKTTVIGTVSENLCLERIPGQGRSGLCDIAATQANGGDIQQLVTEAFLRRGFEADVALQNAGGVRIDIPAGEITINDAFTLLPFANTLVYLDMTGAEIKQVLEEAVENATKPDGSSGAYPYAANLRWHIDLSQPFGERLSNIEIRRRGSSEWLPLMDDDEVKVVTNSFVADGRDGYFTFGDVKDDGRLFDTYIDYAQGFIDYVQQDLGGAEPGDPILAEPPVIDPVPCGDYSTQQFIDAEGVLIMPDPMFPRTCE